MGAADSTVTLRRRARSRRLPSQRHPKEGRYACDGGGPVRHEEAGGGGRRGAPRARSPRGAGAVGRQRRLPQRPSRDHGTAAVTRIAPFLWMTLTVVCASALASARLPCCPPRPFAFTNEVAYCCRRGDLRTDERRSEKPERPDGLTDGSASRPQEILRGRKRAAALRS